MVYKHSHRPAMQSRSHHGCTRCKQRRQKCDEKRPSCSRCVNAGTSCLYHIMLKWDGRVPRMEKASSRQNRKTAKPFKRTGECRQDMSVQLLGQAQRSIVGDTLDILELDLFESLSYRDKLLINHFITKLSMIASHTSVREQACQTILPMALEIPSLMYATLAFSALHLSELADPQVLTLISDDIIRDILASSIAHLREGLEMDGTKSRQPLLLTVKTLCLFEIYSGKYNSSWRTHFKGARALLESMRPEVIQYSIEPGAWLIARWYTSVEGLSALTNAETQNEEQHAFQPINDSITERGSGFDIYAGYSSDLHLVFRGIGNLMQKYPYCAGHVIQDEMSSELNRTYLEVHGLEEMVLTMIHRDREEGLHMPDERPLSLEEIRMFSACNTAYQYSALLYIRRRLFCIDSESDQVQSCVRAILDAVCDMLPVVVLSPWILLTTPLFTAGCEAKGLDRERVRSLLFDLYMTLRIPNILRAIGILESYWEQPDDNYTELAGFLPF
ncbi:fungal-specific transcription factor domain-containing protein [Talaromyces proteolyticus]|uniref:Fungal-specific transcription factor domain-containing protein n=1 Tax=Talaromyces proteolyticus TaxID=1131652 RepID=A0AAD4KHB8_9EURO|nr:fungal-specific transcription factor domain-containing protein [Talaromyces proteolyticus]KAH8692164.1 fungal-specific transcription factor domain-containing protein [Talaromyces proteolyticus]